MRQPASRPEAFDIYWRFAYERQRVFEARLSGAPGPWTSDPILAKFKFCNVYRAADRVSQYLIQNIAYADDGSTDADRAFQITAFRTFSNIATWDAMRATFGRNPTIENLLDGSFETALTRIKEDNGRLYTGAFILCATDAYGRRTKHLNHVELFKHMFLDEELGKKIPDQRSLKDVYDLLHTFPLMGDFMSYQTAIDLNYSELTNFSENDFTQPGPGALRGIRKVFVNTAGMTPAALTMWMVEHQDQEFERRGLDFRGLFGRPIQAIDAQNLFCETDKYCREALPHLASARTRIKARHIANPTPIEYWFPPKWNISPAVSAGVSSRAAA